MSLRTSRMARFLACAACAGVLGYAAESSAYSRTWYKLTTGNGHGFQVFDRQEGRINVFLEHPYRYLVPANNKRDGGIGRRNLAHDIYFGVRANGQSTWLHDLHEPSYDNQTNIITASSTQNGVKTDVYYYSPYGYEGNAMVMLIKVTNQNASGTISVYAKPNLKLGSTNDRVSPGFNGESITWNNEYAVETGPGGGHAIYIPIGGVSAAGCGGDTPMYEAVKASGNVGSQSNCNADNQVMVFQKDLNIAAGQSAWWGTAVLFVNDNPSDSALSAFKDPRSVNDVISDWKAFVGNKDAEAMYKAARDEWDDYHAQESADAKETYSHLSADEKKVWDQSSAVLRMALIREKNHAGRKNHGMMLAALPVGEWHTGWVRDGAYAIVALARTGHTDLAQKAIEFLLNANAGFFTSSYSNVNGGYDFGLTTTENGTKRPYRISACRHYGNGDEEGDWNYFGPNVQTDGWGLSLWAARHAFNNDCTWLDKVTEKGDTVINGLYEIAEDIKSHVDSNYAPFADCSTWEVHWDWRKQFTFTAATQIRGLYDFAAIAQAYGTMKNDQVWLDRAATYRTLAGNMRASAIRNRVNSSNAFVSHLGVISSPAFADGSAGEMLGFGLVEPDAPSFLGTLNAAQNHLLTACGGYRRLDQNLSIVGETTATAYDISEWVLMDLRLSGDWRKYGDTAKADAQLNRITQFAMLNDGLIPELLNNQNCDYDGVVPMAGFGAGAWQIAQMEKYNHFEPAIGEVTLCAGGVQACTPDCEGKQCGSDGCDGNCGVCNEANGEVCNALNQCIVMQNCGDGVCSADDGEDCSSCSDDCGECCGNGECEPNLGEYCNSCILDCACGEGLTCNDTARDCIDPNQGGTIIIDTDAGISSTDDAYNWEDGAASLCSSTPAQNSNPWSLAWLFGIPFITLGARRLQRKGARNAR